MVLPCVLSAAGLIWDKTSIDREIEAGTPEIRIEIPFCNEGAQPVTITGLKSSCGCTELVLKDRTIPAGAKGVLNAVYKPGDRVGPQQSAITVKTDGADGTTEHLYLRVNILPVLTVQPAMLRWSLGEKPVARTLLLKRVRDVPVEIVDVKPERDNVQASWKASGIPGTWELTLTPRSTAEMLTTKVAIHTRVNGKPITFAAFAVVR